MEVCELCHKELTSDDIGMTKKMISRGCTSFMCIPCLAKTFHCDETLLRQKMQQFKKMGCMLFAQDDDV